jgi:hypothetical protein
MPREVTAYLCSYRCGHKSQTKIKRVEEHEKRCAMNPTLRTCKTCKHDRNGGRDEGFYCDIDKKPEEEGNILNPFAPTRPVILMRNCPYWESNKIEMESEA